MLGGVTFKFRHRDIRRYAIGIWIRIGLIQIDQQRIGKLSVETHRTHSGRRAQLHGHVRRR